MEQIEKKEILAELEWLRRRLYGHSIEERVPLEYVDARIDDLISIWKLNDN